MCYHVNWRLDSACNQCVIERFVGVFVLLWHIYCFTNLCCVGRGTEPDLLSSFNVTPYRPYNIFNDWELYIIIDMVLRFSIS